MIQYCTQGYKSKPHCNICIHELHKERLRSISLTRSPLLLTWPEGNNILLASIYMKDNYCLQSGHKLFPYSSVSAPSSSTVSFLFPVSSTLEGLIFLSECWGTYIHSEPLLQACLWEDERTKIVILYCSRNCTKQRNSSWRKVKAKRIKDT